MIYQIHKSLVQDKTVGTYVQVTKTAKAVTKTSLAPYPSY